MWRQQTFGGVISVQQMTFISSPDLCQTSHTLWSSPDFQTNPGFLSLSDTTCQCHRSRNTDSALSQGDNLPITRTGQAASQYKLVQNQRWSSPPKSRLQCCFPATSLCQLCRPARPFYILKVSQDRYLQREDALWHDTHNEPQTELH